ncbi:hypothetical protein [Frondihabitans sp. 762G35]|uniref:hypothetical protein n=1 Tax=Frondihabitans sp. 762G35 TaxID=1446794 RepID=UPI000F4E5967|nr:hypothetical protein [Frondihabitans sp. 762G35]
MMASAGQDPSAADADGAVEAGVVARGVDEGETTGAGAAAEAAGRRPGRSTSRGREPRILRPARS